MWEGMFQVEQEDMDMVELVRERAQKRREKIKKQRRVLDRENSMGLSFLFGGGGGDGGEVVGEEVLLSLVHVSKCVVATWLWPTCRTFKILC